MFKIRNREGRSEVALICESCGSEITNAGEGAVIFRGTEIEGPLQVPWFSHKGECHDRLEMAIRAAQDRPHWMELQHFLVYALNKVGLDDEGLEFARAGALSTSRA
jgi:hypothetical protein